METLDFLEEPTRSFAPRHYQTATVTALNQGWAEGFTRQLVVWATGTGKGSLAAMLAEDIVRAGKKMLFFAHRESLIRQTAKRIAEHGGVEVEIEMAGERASLHAQVVCASIQTLQSTNRLTGFPDDHFDLVVIDESHHSVADGYVKVMNYFHYGAESLTEGWQVPLRGTPYKAKCRIVGLTATPDIQGKKSLGDIYQKAVPPYDLLAAVKDGYLVRPISMSIPLKVDLRGLKATRTSHGSDISDGALSERLAPVLMELAAQVAAMAKDRKTVVFVPSVECAKIMDKHLREEGMDSSFVSGACPDAMDKLEAFRAKGRGSVIANALMITEGVDIPDVSCVVIARATKARGFYTQMCGRASRPLPGLIDHLLTAEERRAAILASAKPNFLILDPLWVSDRLNLVQPYFLVTSNPQKAKLMEDAAGAVNDLAEMEITAERDLLDALAKEAKKHSKKKARTIDPLTYASLTESPDIASYQPKSEWDALKPDPGQIAYMEKRGLGAVDTRGLAELIILRDIEREKMNLATPKQMQFLTRLGFSDHDAAAMTKGKAGAIIGRYAR